MPAVISYARRFGITAPLQPYLSVALGSDEISLYEQTSAYSVFPNDGVRITPRYITRVTDYEGRLLEEDFPDVKDAISQRTARILTSMLREVVLHGTAIAASKLPFPVAGKTGTTNDFTDAWFVGFSPAMTCGVWVGFDEKRTLGAKETGARAALPIWLNFMTAATSGKMWETSNCRPPCPTLSKKSIRPILPRRRKKRTENSCGEDFVALHPGRGRPGLHVSFFFLCFSVSWERFSSRLSLRPPSLWPCLREFLARSPHVPKTLCASREILQELFPRVLRPSSACFAASSLCVPPIRFRR